MANVTKDYELLVAVSLANGEEAAASTVEKVKSIVESGATITSVDDWGKRKLAYPINDEVEGYYVIVSFNSAADAIKEFSRKLNITDGILRSLITVK